MARSLWAALLAPISARRDLLLGALFSWAALRVVLGAYLYFFIISPFYSPYYTGSLRFVRELSFNALYI